VFLVHQPVLLLLTLTQQHVGIRGAINSWKDYEDDAAVDFIISHAEDIEDVGYKGIVKRIREVVGDNPVYSEHSTTLIYCGY
jgi:agmatinase